MSLASMLLGVLFGSRGFGYFLYGRKQAAMMPRVCGLLLVAFPFGATNPYSGVGVGVA